ncbi:hypothetical protein CY652_21305 [Burkholderia sp. WAC0059]|nr:hypothetical protein CY652_21305 [Burkholderia sp. WAC0059]
MWSCDFVFDACGNGPQLKCLTVVDKYPKSSGTPVVVNGNCTQPASGANRDSTPHCLDKITRGLQTDIYWKLLSPYHAIIASLCTYW